MKELLLFVILTALNGPALAQEWPVRCRGEPISLDCRNGYEWTEPRAIPSPIFDPPQLAPQTTLPPMTTLPAMGGSMSSFATNAVRRDVERDVAIARVSRLIAERQNEIDEMAATLNALKAEPENLP